MFTGIYGVFGGKSGYRDFRIAWFTFISAFNINSVGMPFMDFVGKVGKLISPKSVCSTVQIMWVSHIILTGK